MIGTASFPVSEDIEITAPVLAPSGSKDDVNATAVATEVVCYRSVCRDSVNCE